MAVSTNFFPDNEHAALPILPLAEDVDRHLLVEELELQQRAVFNPDFPAAETDLHVVLGGSQLELSLHPDTPVSESKQLLHAAEQHFENAYDDPAAPPESLVESGHLLACLPLFESRIYHREPITEDIVSDCTTDLLDLGQDLEERIGSDPRLQHANARIIFSALLLRHGIGFYPTTWREGRFRIRQTDLSADQRRGRHNTYAIYNSQKVPARSFGKSTKVQSSEFAGLRLHLTGLILATNAALGRQIVGQHTPPLTAGNHIRNWLRQDQEGSASKDTSLFLHTLSEQLLQKIVHFAEG